MNQETSDDPEDDYGQKTGWGFECGYGRFIMTIQWIGLFHRWQSTASDESIMTHWIALYTKKTDRARMVSLIINPLKISLAWAIAEEDEAPEDECNQH